MDWEGLIDFSVNIRQIRDEAEAYQETMQTKYLPNIYTEKYADVVTSINRLVKSLTAEIAEQARQLGIKEGALKLARKKRRRVVIPISKSHACRGAWRRLDGTIQDR